jgi:hypothetical protein
MQDLNLEFGKSGRAFLEKQVYHPTPLPGDLIARLNWEHVV